MTSAITFDAGALIAIERRSRRMQALLEEIDDTELDSVGQGSEHAHH